MQSLAPSRSHVNAFESSGVSPPESWEARVAMWCQHCGSAAELAHMVRAARTLQELASAIDVIRDYKNPGVASEVIRCL